MCRIVPIMLILALLVVVLGTTGCRLFSSSVSSTKRWTEDVVMHRHIDDDPVAINVSGPVSLDVESFNGSVTVDVDEDLEHATVTTTRWSTHGYGRRDEAGTSLDEITITCAIVPGELGQVLQVRVATTHPEPYFQHVDLHIKAPKIDGLRVHTKKGNVVARDIEGAVDVSVDEGDVRVMTPRPMRRKVQIINNKGDVDFRIRAESTGELDCQAIRGLVTHHVSHGRMIIHPGTTHNALLATLNEGGNPILLRAADGDVRVAVVPNPTHVGVFIGPN